MVIGYVDYSFGYIACTTKCVICCVLSHRRHLKLEVAEPVFSSMGMLPRAVSSTSDQCISTPKNLLASKSVLRYRSLSCCRPILCEGPTLGLAAAAAVLSLLQPELQLIWLHAKLSSCQLPARTTLCLASLTACAPLHLDSLAIELLAPAAAEPQPQQPLWQPLPVWRPHTVLPQQQQLVCMQELSSGLTAQLCVW